MRALPDPARIRVVDERLVKKRVELSVHGMMQKTITHARLVDIARLGVADFKMFVASMSVRFILQLLVKLSDLIYQVTLKF